MNETHILIRLLRMYIPRNWEFSSALAKLWNFGGWREGVEPPNPPRYASDPKKRAESVETGGSPELVVGTLLLTAVSFGDLLSNFNKPALADDKDAFPQLL
jgi:hypothetical protein